MVDTFVDLGDWENKGLDDIIARLEMSLIGDSP